MEALVTRSIDTTVSMQEAQNVYNRNQETFKLNEELIKFRYINVNENIDGIEEIKKRFKNFNYEDKRILDSISLQFKASSLNDPISIKLDQDIKKIPAVTSENKKYFI